MNSKMFYIFCAYFLCLCSLTVGQDPPVGASFSKLTADSKQSVIFNYTRDVVAYIPPGQCSGVISGALIPCHFPIKAVLTAYDNPLPVLYISKNLDYLEILRRRNKNSNKCGKESYVKAHFQCTYWKDDPKQEVIEDIHDAKVELPEAEKPHKVV